MRLEDQVCSLELAKRLKKLGVKQESYFCYVKVDVPNETYSTQSEAKEWGEFFIVSFKLEKKVYFEDKNDFEPQRVVSYGCGCCFWDLEVKEHYSAFTVAELGEMLPLWWDSGKREDKDYICRVFEKNVTNTHHSFGSSEADARAKMLIYLIENGLIKERDDATCQRKEGEEQERI